MLRAVLGHAAEASVWHRGRLAGVEIDQITSDDLSALPIMTETDLVENRTCSSATRPIDSGLESSKVLITHLPTESSR